MKVRASLLLTAVAVLPIASCAFPGSMVVNGSGRPATQDFDVKAFTTVEAHGAFDVQISRADKCAVSVTTDDNLMEFVNVTEDGDKLILSMDQGGKPLGVRPKVGLKALVTLPQLDGVTLHGACTASAEGIEHVKTFQVTAGGASKFTGDISADKVDVTADGASTVTLRGAAKSGVVQASGASSLHLADLNLARANVRLSGASSGTVNAKDKLDYDVSGASHLHYKGQPSIGEKNASGASSATPN
jgi:Putative auto-transporter adhesin, head GIN domain